MKICWDSLENIRLTENGNLRVGSNIYVEKSACRFCGDAYLTTNKAQNEYCSKSCSSRSNLIGRRFDRLKVLEFSEIKHNNAYWKCICDCGNTHIASNSSLVNGYTKSCGCLRRETTIKYNYIHGKCGTKEYWCHISNKRRATKLEQTPDTANIQKIQLYYTICAYLNEPCKMPMWHVDHIKPISKGGFHHEDNLQILTAKLNLEKRAKCPLTDAEQVKYKGVKI